MKPRLLDLFCCAGGAGTGYARAGFEVFGIDIDPQPNYPYEFHQADALEYLAEHGHEFDAIHASPPCQGYTALKAVHGNEWPLLIEPTRDLLDSIGKPYVIENVQGAPLRRDLTLCGEMFGLGVIRHRYFELGYWSTPEPQHLTHRGRVAGWRHGQFYDGPYFAVYGLGGGKGSLQQWQQAMGIDWTNDRHEIAEAIPPAYTEFIGRQLLAHINQEAAA
ncbi:DNA cytosine methyltransferase [Curtobacterium sp. MCLR17_034]|uniref:DNA cytosine methyltransferase n=1 Tax=Curtobacterium sp. MCLR17_034 TaxID=2175623 RepID=UPI000DA8379A|nr:DNA cytosine methyltransferase [Curtobacterium sp. MCLR17_034]PZF11751.1 DNA methylase [Curtobacterium sp. MCLR17_034]